MAAGSYRSVKKMSWLEDKRRLLRMVRVRLETLRYRGLSLQEMFERIYTTNAWKSEEGALFDSGSGSADAFTHAYIETIAA